MFRRKKEKKSKHKKKKSKRNASDDNVSADEAKKVASVRSSDSSPDRKQYASETRKIVLLNQEQGRGKHRDRSRLVS